MPDLEDGTTTEMKGSGSRPYVIKNVGGVYSCTCPAWRNQSLQPHQRTCKHIRKLRGDDAEKERLGAAALSPPPRKAEGPPKEGPPVLLAESWDTQSDVTGWWMSEKLDGARAFWDGKQFVSRLGNTFVAPDFFTAGLPDVPLDGELWIARKSFQRTMSVIKRQDRPAEWKEVRYVVFDAPAHGGPFEARQRFLADLLAQRPSDHVRPLDQEPCRGADHLLAELDRLAAIGGEGLMLRQPGSPYEAGRSPTLLKVKRFHDAEARVVGYVPGAGKHQGRTGSLEVQLPDGVRFAVGTGLSDAERVSPPPVGSTITFRYQELSDGGVPRFPSYLGVRKDGAVTAAPATPSLGTPPPTVKAIASAAPSATRTLEYAGGAGVRVWEVIHQGNIVTQRFGTAAAMQNKTQAYPSASDAASAVAELIADKLDDGFVERGTTPRVETPAPPPTGGKRYFEYVEGTSSKFWETWIEGTRMTARYGRIGSHGTTTIKDFADEAAARKAMDKAVAEKAKKGYAEKGTGDEAFSYDDALVTGDDDALNDYIVESGKCLVVDWREEEQEMLEQLLQILPQAGLRWEGEEEEEDLYVTFGGVRSKVGLTMSPKDRYILLRRLNEIMAGKYELRAFRCTLDSDTHCFYPQSAAWWSRMEAMFPERVAEVFARIAPGMDF